MLVGFRIIAGLCCLAVPAAASEPADVAAFIEAARGADIVVLGEVHDNPAHHRTQAAIVKALQPAALVFEMIPQADEDKVNELRSEGAGREAIAAALALVGERLAGLRLLRRRSWRRRRRRMVFGAGQPAADVRRATVEGAAGVFGPDAVAYGLDKPLAPEEQAAREAILAAAHCETLPAEILPGMVEAQRFRDAGLADAALWARTMTGDGQVVVIAGSGHADKARGMPAALAVAAPDLKVVALGQFEPPPDDPQDFDAVLLAPPPVRDDPCRRVRTPGD